MAEEKDSKLSNEEIKELAGKIKDTIHEEMKQAGYVEKGDFDELLKAHGQVQIMEMINHKPHDDNSDCGICTMKTNIDAEAFKRGLVSGIRVGRKYPEITA